MFRDMIEMGLSSAGIALLCALAVAVEYLYVRDRRRLWRAAAFNITYGLVTATVLAPATNLARVGGTALVNATGAGFIVLPAAGWLFPLGVLAFLALTDFLEYAFHSAQHKIPWLWRMHSLHHSEERMNATTAMRNFWLEGIIRLLVIVPITGVVFVAAPSVVLAARMLQLANHICCHMGLSWNWGRLWWLCNSPQYHRCHHSFAPAHIDKNLADIFPVWDLIFGTVYRPIRGEFPPTGIMPSVQPNLSQAVLWPVAVAR